MIVRDRLRKLLQKLDFRPDLNAIAPERPLRPDGEPGECGTVEPISESQFEQCLHARRRQDLKPEEQQREAHLPRKRVRAAISDDA